MPVSRRTSAARSSGSAAANALVVVVRERRPVAPVRRKGRAQARLPVGADGVLELGQVGVGPARSRPWPGSGCGRGSSRRSSASASTCRASSGTARPSAASASAPSTARTARRRSPSARSTRPRRAGGRSRGPGSTRHPGPPARSRTGMAAGQLGGVADLGDPAVANEDRRASSQSAPAEGSTAAPSIRSSPSATPGSSTRPVSAGRRPPTVVAALPAADEPAPAGLCCELAVARRRPRRARWSSPAGRARASPRRWSGRWRSGASAASSVHSAAGSKSTMSAS